MDNRVVADPDTVTCDWLTDVLSRSGALSTGRVVEIGIERVERRLSLLGHLTLSYSDDASGRCPHRLFLKVCPPGRQGFSFGRSEVDYYTRDYIGVPDLPLLTCYDAAFSAADNGYHILLDDVSATHEESHDKTPTLAYGRDLAGSLARMHAHWWGEERLRSGGHPLPAQSAIERYVGVARLGLVPILALTAGRLEPGWDEALAEVFAHHPEMMVRRAANETGLTLVHGDVNPGNILSLRELSISSSALGLQPIYLIDRQPFDWSLKSWLGISDLAYAIVHWWEPEERRALEQPLLRHYHEHLQANGIHDYSWTQLLYDYRLAAVQSIYVAVQWCRGDREMVVANEWIWFPMLQRAMTAFFDLECSRLWREAA